MIDFAWFLLQIELLDARDYLICVYCLWYFIKINYWKRENIELVTVM